MFRKAEFDSMRARVWYFVVLGLSVLLPILSAHPARGQAAGTKAPPGEKIDIVADDLNVDEKGNVVEAVGNVEIRRGETVLKADEVRMNRSTQSLEAKGRISVDDPEWKLKAESAQFNLERETGVIGQGEIFLERGHVTMAGKRFEKYGGQTYHIDQGFFTTCLCESGPPSWKISGEEIDLRREGEGVIKGARLYVLDVPVLYLPYASLPVRTERQTGFLFPKIGYSSKEGFRFEQPFFWAISKSADATFGVDVESRARIGLLGELRTIISRDVQAHINVSYFNEGLRKNEEGSIKDKTIADPEIPQDRWSLIGNHRHQSASDWITYSDAFVFSDDRFARELVDRFDLGGIKESDIQRSRFSRSRFGFFRGWNDSYLKGEWDFYQDFIQKDENTFQRTPQLLWTGQRALGDSPLELRWWAEGVNYFRREGADGLRFDLRPALVLPFQMADYLVGSFNAALRETAYHLHNTESTFDRNRSRELVELRWNMGSSVERIFDRQVFHVQKLKHVIEPELSYLFVPSTNQRDIPIFDGTDRINRRNVLTFAVTNRLWGKFAQEPAGRQIEQDVELVASPTMHDTREMASLRLALSYDIDRERKGGDSLSDLDLNLRLTPFDNMAIGFDAGFDPGPWQVTQAAVLLSVADPRPLRPVLDRDFMRPNSVDLSYRFIRRGVNSPFADNANLVFQDLSLPPACPAPAGVFDPRCERFLDKNVLSELGVRTLYHLTDRVLLLYDVVYNARDGRFTNNRGGIKLLSQCECWTLSFSVKRTTNPDKTSIGFEFNLLGLSSQNSGLFR
ncbi:MAG: LPS-assembly protein LptD [Deltaproteobacteria bacterium]|nr:LPS-assembly protein LptD [Deltaproteobacteria bacterium]